MANLLEFNRLGGTWQNGNDFLNVEVLKMTGPRGIHGLLYTCHINIDYDGASTAYGPPEKVALDHVVNAGYPRWYYGLLALHPQARLFDMDNKSYETFRIGTKGELATKHFKVTLDLRFPDSKGRCPVFGENGYYVSASPHRHGKFEDFFKQSSYTDAATVPFGALSGNLEKDAKVSLGDCGVAIRYNMDRNCPFYFSDRGSTTGPKVNRVGECSYALFLALGGEKKVPYKTPDNNWAVCFTVFPGSATGGGKPSMDRAIRAQMELINQTDNARELPLLMAFAGMAHDGSAGKRNLEDYRRMRPEAQQSLLPPPGYHNIVRGLRAYGFQHAPLPRPGPQPVPA